MNLKYIYIIVIGICFCIACQDEETITPRGVVFESRFEFPQGDAEWDKTAQEIRDKFGVYLIYTSFDTLDLRRQWTTGAKKLYGDTLTDKQAASCMKFMKEHVFAYLTPEITKRALPAYYYLVYNYRYPSYGSNFTFQVNSYDGLDFWVSSIYSEKEPIVSTWEQYRNRRYRNLRHIFRKICERGNVVAPNEFHDGFDYTTALASYSDLTNPNHFKNRGFPGEMSGDNMNFPSLTDINKITPEINFLLYINLGMRYVGDELEKAYPKATYPLIHQKRDYVVKYMNEKYNVDLEAMAQGPEL